uniref:hypothetical protein n=1 Tax=Pseudonocardia lacus TaxID=2835865 RepID=UPI001BDD627A
MRWWKILGLAGLAGVAATGAVTAHAERRRRAYTPDEVRARLHERVAASGPPAPPAVADDPAGDAPAGDDRSPAARLRHA